MQKNHATFLGIVSIVLWSTTVAFARSIAEQLGPLTAACCIYALGGLLSSLVFYFQHRKFPFQQNFSTRYLLVCGTLFVLYMVSLYSAIGLASGRTQLLEIGLINYLWPVLTVVFSIPLLRQRASGLLFIGCVCALIGTYLVTTQDGATSITDFVFNILSNPAAYGLAFLAAVTWAAYSNFSRVIGEDQPAGAVTLFMFMTAATLFLLRGVFPENSNWSSYTLLEVGYMSVVATLGYVFWDIGTRKGDFSAVSTSSYLLPFLSTLMVCLYLSVFRWTEALDWLRIDPGWSVYL